jgi:hypothetical protein
LGLLGGVIGAWIGSIWAQDEETYGLWFQISFQVLSAGVMGAGLLTGIVVERGWGVPVGTLVVAMMSAWSGLSAAFLSDERVRGSADDG